MKTIIRRVPERDITELLDELPNSLIYNDVNYTGCINSFNEAIKMANDDCIYIQDDIELADNFMEKAMKAINERPHSVIVFCNMTIDKSCKHVTSEGYYHPRHGFWQYCTYIPKAIACYYLSWYENEGYKSVKGISKILKNDFDDALFARFLEKIEKDVYVVIPNIAQHKRMISVVNPNRPVNRQSASFKKHDEITNAKVDVKIMAVKEREPYVVDMLQKLNMSKDIVIWADEKSRDAMSTAKRAWLSPIEDGITHRIVLQDDLLLSNHFVEYMTRIANKHPKAVINPYNSRLSKDDRRKKYSLYQDTRRRYLWAGDYDTSRIYRTFFQ